MVRACLIALLLVTGGAMPLAAQEQAEPPLTAALLAMQPGDLIVRRSKGLTSTLFASVNARDTRYSHAGMVVQTRDGRVQVAHAELDELSESGGARLTDPVTFLAGVLRWAVIRFPLSPEEGAATSRIALSYVTRAAGFDLDFDLAEDSRLYCTEFVWRAVLDATGRDLVQDKPLIQGRPVITVEDLVHVTGARVVIESDAGG